MNVSRWTRSALALCIMGTLTACGDGGADPNNQGDVVTTPPAASGSSSSSSSGGSSSGGSSSGGSSGGEGATLHENFGDGMFANFDEADTQYFFSQEYKALNAANAEDSWPSFYYPTCCFFANDNPADGPEVALEQMGIVSDNGNPAMLLDTGRFTVGQGRPASADPDDKDPKKDTTTSDDVSTWGELDLSSDYRISFCVKAASGTRNMQVYVDNNTSGEANSIWGGGGTGSRIFNVPASDLIPGERVQINVPGDITYQQGGETKDIRQQLVGAAGSFLQLRVEGGSSVIFDDLLIEPQSADGQADLPECTEYQPAKPPEAPEAPALTVGDGHLIATWSDVLGATGFELAYNTADSIEGATTVAAADIEGTQHTLESLENDTEYFVFLRVINSEGPGDWSVSASATPVAPKGEACVPTTQVDTAIAWSVYDGCRSPSEPASIVYDTSVSGTFDFGSSDTSLFVAIANDDEENIGHAKLDTTADADARSRGEVYDIFTEGYPKHFTAIARIKADSAAQRGFELQTYFAEAGKRVNMVLRPDQGDTGEVRLEKFIDGADDVKVAAPLLDGEFHTYHIAFTMTDADTLNAKVFVDGADTPIIDETSTGREDSSANNKLRVGEDSSSAHLAEVDWIIWTTDAMTAAKLPSELVAQLPATVGDLGSYADGATAWEASTLDLAGESGSAPIGETTYVAADAVTMNVSGGSASSDSVRNFFVHQKVTGPFTFTARLKSVTLQDGASFTTDSNSYRFGVAVMESLDPSLDGDIKGVGRFATIDYWADVDSTTGDVSFAGARAHKLDVGDTDQSKRSRSDADIAIGDLLKVEIIDEDGVPRVIRSVSTDDGATFTQLNSSAFKDDSAAGFSADWYVGVYGAPGDGVILEFTDIEISQP